MGIPLVVRPRPAEKEIRLSNADEAWAAMIVWLRCLNRMSEVAG